MRDFPVIPGFRIVKMLGQGGMADVYEAIQENLDRKVAIKVIIPELFRDMSFSVRFVKEAQTAAKLSHPHVLHIYDVGATSNCNYIVMECLQQSLKDRLKSGALLPDLALQVMLQMGQALDYAHRKGFVHRDIKPDNILFREDGTAVLTDFGIAKAVDSSTKLTRTGTSVGTPHYMSPEQIRGSNIDGRADFYSLGIVFYEMLIGKVPYEATDPLAICMKHLHESIPVLPKPLWRFQPLLEELLSKDPGQRLDSGDKLENRINVLLGASKKPFRNKKLLTLRLDPDNAHEEFSGLTQEHPSQVNEHGGKKKSSRLLFWLTGSLAIVLLIMIAVWNTQSHDSGATAIREPFHEFPEKQAVQAKRKDPEIATQGEQLAAAKEGANKKEQAEQQRRKEENKTIASQQKTVVAERLAVEKRQMSQSGQESAAAIPVNNEWQRIGLFELDPQLVLEYGQKFQRIDIAGVLVNINAFGQIFVLLNVDAAGKVFIHSMDTLQLMVDPPSSQVKVEEAISRALIQVRLLPPKDRAGQSAILEKWRLSFKIVALTEKLILIKQ